MSTSTRDTVENALRHPVSWFAGGVISTITVLASVGIDPVTATAVIVSILINNAMTAFTAASIFGFTIGPHIAGLPVIGTIPTWPFKGLAVVFGLIAVAKIVAGLWDTFKARLRGD